MLGVISSWKKQSRKNRIDNIKFVNFLSIAYSVSLGAQDFK